MKKRLKRILTFAAIALVLFGSVRLLACVIDIFTEKETWFLLIAAGLGFLCTAGIVFYAVQHLLPKPYLKKSVILITTFYVVVGISMFFLPANFVHPPASARLIDDAGQALHSVCPKDGQLFPKGQKLCPYHLVELINADREALEEAGIDLDGSPFQRMLHQPGEETLTVSATNFGGQDLPFKLNAGQKLTVKASGEARDGMTGRESGPDGKEGTPFLRLDRNYQCGSNFLALCIKVGSQPWQYCGSECTVVSNESEALVTLNVNDATSDLNGRYHPEWWADNAGGFEVTYVRP
ncbi:MAG: hypothetical protein PHN19_04675 [Patescibacteria group bacterium]|nr:hypothetical protein [Patescibacteria group bacterium]